MLLQQSLIEFVRLFSGYINFELNSALTWEIFSVLCTKAKWTANFLVSTLSFFHNLSINSVSSLILDDGCPPGLLLVQEEMKWWSMFFRTPSLGKDSKKASEKSFEIVWVTTVNLNKNTKYPFFIFYYLVEARLVKDQFFYLTLSPLLNLKQTDLLTNLLHTSGTFSNKYMLRPGWCWWDPGESKHHPRTATSN